MKLFLCKSATGDDDELMKSLTNSSTAETQSRSVPTVRELMSEMTARGEDERQNENEGKGEEEEENGRRRRRRAEDGEEVRRRDETRGKKELITEGVKRAKTG